MSYFKHAFHKEFLATKATQAAVGGTSAAVANGFLNQAGIHTKFLNDTGVPYSLGVGTFGMFNKETYLSVVAASTEVTTGQPLVLAGASLYQLDKIGPFHGGYTESTKSKIINPRYINHFTKTVCGAPEQAVCHIGNTNFTTELILSISDPGAGYPDDGVFVGVPVTGGTGVGMTVDVTIVGGEVTAVVENENGSGYVATDILTLDPTFFSAAPTTDAEIEVEENGPCDFEFLCGETYNLQVTLFGSPVLRLLTHDAYVTFAAYTGCCPSGSIAPTPVDSTLVYIDWAKQIITHEFTKNFVRPIVYTEAGDPLFATAAEAVAAGYLATDIWDNYVSPGHTPGANGGIRLASAYVETKFGNCSFQNTDFYEKEIVQMNISLVDLNGDPCTFEGLCVICEHKGYQGQGFGETLLRKIILDERYKQNDFATDIRIREITQGTDLFTAVNRNALYTQYTIVHSIPRPQNFNSALDADQYALNIYMPCGAAGTAFEAFMAAWLTAANSPVTLKTYGHTPFVYAAI